MNKPTIIAILVIFVFLGYLALDAQKEANAMEDEMKRYEELYINCKLNHDPHMKEHEGEFQLN